MPSPTSQQHAAIQAEGNVLVMAGAGAGKTSTLVARILDRILDHPQRVPLDRILVVTFNEAAAAEMRHRLGLALDARLQADPDNLWIAEQRALLDTADVCTLHAFCLRLLREHFHELELDPQFIVLDELQTRVQRNTVLLDLLRSHLDPSPSSSPAIQSFLNRHARDRWEAIQNLILAVHDYARSLPEPREWIAEQQHRHTQPLPQSWFRHASLGIASWAAAWLEHARLCLESTPDSPPAQTCHEALVLLAHPPTHLEPTAPPDVPPAFPTPTVLTQLARVVNAGDKSRLDRKKAASWLRPLKPLIQEARALLEWIGPVPGGPDSALEQDWTWCRNDVAALLDLVSQFDEAFTRTRRAAAGVDFADLEQLALRLLWNPLEHRPTTLALHYRQRLERVFVDEYQDINGAQDRILECLSREGAQANRFLVGDVKQSIYRFRRADPRIFQSYARSWRSTPNAAVLPLTENFRSHQAILGFVNALFAPLLREEAGGVAYDEEAQLQLGAPEARPEYRDRPEGRIECHLLVPEDNAPSDIETATGSDTPSDVSTDFEAAADGEPVDTDLDAEETQARLAARRLRELREQPCPILDGTQRCFRPAQWRDMVVLHPAPRAVSERWARAFACEGVPLDARRGGFFDAIEVSDLLHLVRLLDNPRQDLPLLAVLRSPLVGMTLEELAVLRLAEPRAGLWQALEALTVPPRPTPAGSSPHPLQVPELRPLAEAGRAKAVAFLQAHGRWRRIATRGSLAACLETVLAETGYEAWILSQPRADAQRANLRRLLALTRQFDTLQRHGLFRFIQFLEAQSDAAESVESASAVSDDSVRLLSMHQSKGLEFPLVVVAGLGRKFNVEELVSDWLLDPDFGICPPVLPPGHRRGYHSLPRWLAGQRQRQERIGEQLRLLYVACTRASERLLLLGTSRSSRFAVWKEHPGRPSLRHLIEAQSPLDWLGPLLPHIAGCPNLFEVEHLDSPTLTWRLWHRLPPPPQPAAPTLDNLHPAPDDSALARTHTRLAWEYPWPAATWEPAKAAVTALRRQWLANDETAPAPETIATPPKSHTPSIANVGDRSAAIDRGLAHHLFNEHVDLAQTGSEESLRSEAARLAEEGWLAPEVANTLDFAGLAGFWSSPVAQALREAPSRVARELPFTLRLKATDAAALGNPRAGFGFSADDYQVVQGVVDLALVRPKDLWIVDFKTDRVRPEEVASRTQEYAPQLRLYAFALREIYRRPVTHAWLYFLVTRDLVPVPL